MLQLKLTFTECREPDAALGASAKLSHQMVPSTCRGLMKTLVWSHSCHGETEMQSQDLLAHLTLMLWMPKQV